MTNECILITGGAGFIGSHLTDELLNNGYHVRVLDSLDPQIHGPNPSRPDYLSGDAEFIRGDVRNRTVVDKALKGVDAVVHLAAAVGVGQSMYKICHYTSVNDIGTATLLEALAPHDINKLVVASSMSIYGEGCYQDSRRRMAEVSERSREQLARGEWELHDAHGSTLSPMPTPESKTPVASSIYALSKYVQERQCLIWGEAYGVPTTAMRFFNVYGPRQALSNPYTGVLAIFSSRYLSGQSPLVFEDGNQRRDFVNVRDVARACRLALESPSANGQAFNIGSGQSHSVLEIAHELARVLDCHQLEPEIVGRYRVGDIRHCFGDISKAKCELGYTPKVSLADGLSELAAWLVEQDQIVCDATSRADKELMQRGLVV